MATPIRTYLQQVASERLRDEVKAERAVTCPCVGCRKVNPNPYGCTRIEGKVEAVSVSAAYLESEGR